MLLYEVLESYLAENHTLMVAELFPSLSRAQSHYLSVMMFWAEKGVCHFLGSSFKSLFTTLVVKWKPPLSDFCSLATMAGDTPDDPPCPIVH